MRAVDELRQPTALRLLTLWHQSGEAAGESVERALLCNAAVLAESCFYKGQLVFDSDKTVLEELTPREMEVLLQQLASGGTAETITENPAFDQARFEALREG